MMGGGGGLFDPTMMQQMLQNPQMQQMMQGLLSNPTYMDQVHVVNSGSLCFSCFRASGSEWVCDCCFCWFLEVSRTHGSKVLIGALLCNSLWCNGAASLRIVELSSCWQFLP